jgi:hypothetical protein
LAVKNSGERQAAESPASAISASTRLVSLCLVSAPLADSARQLALERYRKLKVHLEQKVPRAAANHHNSAAAQPVARMPLRRNGASNIISPCIRRPPQGGHD